MSKKKASAPGKKRAGKTNPGPKEHPGLKKPPVIFIIVVLCAGIGAAWYLATVKLHLKYHPDYVSGCNYSQAVNCDTVQSSVQSELFGIPIALFGIAAYLVMMFLTVMAAAGRGAHQLRALSALFFIGLASCAYSIYLAAVSIFVIRAVCTFCILMYAVNLAVTIVAFLSFPPPRRSVFSAAMFFGPLTSWPVTAGVAIIFWASFGGVYALYANVRSGMIAEYIQRAETREKRPDAAKAGQGGDQAGAVSETDIVPVKTGQGISFMNFPVTPGDHVKGPENAPVTIVQFGDFNCAFCRTFDRDLAPLKKKYEGQVRWIFKHFPLDQDCNPRFKTAHPNACKPSRAAECAAEQGKFWEAYDFLFERPAGYGDKDQADMITALGLDQGRFNECMSSGRPGAKIAADVQDGYRAGISGTPRTYINGYLIAGEVGMEIMEYYIQKAFTRTSDTRAAMTVAKAPSSRTPAAIQMKSAGKPFYIDTFEASVDRQGRAVSMPGVDPAHASWYMAAKACEAAGKRLCTEEEWVTACTGVAAVDNNGNGQFTDDDIEGWMFPYGPYYSGGRCHDSDSKEEGHAGATGSYPGCLSAQGVYDLTGNLSEWAVSATGEPVLMGGHFFLGQKATCAFAVNGLGPGVRNDLTGFRCCSKDPVASSPVTPDELDHIPLGGRVGMPVTDFSFTDQNGKEINRQEISRGLTVITLCKLNDVPGKLELQSLQRLKEEFEPRGVRFLAIIADRDAAATKEMIDALPFKGPVHVDRDQVSMGVFSSRRLPDTYVVDGESILRLSATGGMNNSFDTFRNSLMIAAGLKDR